MKNITGGSPSSAERKADHARIEAAGDARKAGRMPAFALRIKPRTGWKDLTLPTTEIQWLRQISVETAQHGPNMGVLFVGADATGKTMAAEVLANDLALDLYRIDLSSVVNKYIGETEKCLRRLFDAAEDGGAILFLDEADALFGKRTETKDSHDRYASTAISYLLQRIEAFRGLVILAVNSKSGIDPSFLRRLRYVVNFSRSGK